MPTIRLDNVAKIYTTKDYQHVAIRSIDLIIEQGEFVFFVGSRGAGKSTLLNVIAGEAVPDRGQVYLDDVDFNKLPKRQNRRARACRGRIAQDAELKRTETVRENLSVWKWVGPFRKRTLDENLAAKALGIVGVPDCLDRYPRDLSMSECRRVQIAGAILNSPAILMLDDFTDRMDEDTVWDMLHLLNEMNKRGTTVLMATNSSYVVNVMRRRVVTLADGRIVGDVRKGKYGYIS